jgi:hypothetical protein
VTPVGEAIREQLLAEEPWLAKYPEEVAALCAMEARVDLLRLGRVVKPDGTTLNAHDISRFETMAMNLRARLGLTPATAHLREADPAETRWDQFTDEGLPVVLSVLGHIIDAVTPDDPRHRAELHLWAHDRLAAEFQALAEPDADVIMPEPPQARPVPDRGRFAPPQLAIAAVADDDVVDAEILGDDEPDDEELRLDAELTSLRRMTQR